MTRNTYSVTEIEVLHGSRGGKYRFSDEFLVFLETRGLSALLVEKPLLENRADVRLIAAVREFGLHRVSAPGCSIEIETVPAFCDWHIMHEVLWIARPYWPLA